MDPMCQWIGGKRQERGLCLVTSLWSVEEVMAARRRARPVGKRMTGESYTGEGWIRCKHRETSVGDTFPLGTSQGHHRGQGDPP